MTTPTNTEETGSKTQRRSRFNKLDAMGPTLLTAPQPQSPIDDPTANTTTITSQDNQHTAQTVTSMPLPIDTTPPATETPAQATDITAEKAAQPTAATPAAQTTQASYAVVAKPTQTDRTAEQRPKKKTPEAEKLQAMLQLIRTDLPPSNGATQRMFFPAYLADRLTLARKHFIQNRQKVPERAIALTGVLNLLDKMDATHGGPIESAVAWDKDKKEQLRKNIGDFREMPQESFSFGLDEELQHRLRMTAEYTGVNIRQIVATGTNNILNELEQINGRPFDEPPRGRKLTATGSSEATP